MQLVWGFRGEAKDFAWIGTKTHKTFFIYCMCVIQTSRCRPADLMQLVWGFRGGAKDFAWIGTKTCKTYFT